MVDQSKTAQVYEQNCRGTAFRIPVAYRSVTFSTCISFPFKLTWLHLAHVVTQLSGGSGKMLAWAEIQLVLVVFLWALPYPREMPVEVRQLVRVACYVCTAAFISDLAATVWSKCEILGLCQPGGGEQVAIIL